MEEYKNSACNQTKPGIELIAAERKRQIDKGHTLEKDIKYNFDEAIALAAACYATPESEREYAVYGEKERCPRKWPWGHPWWKPSNDRIRELTKAGALIAAEIDRLLAKEQENGQN